MPTTSTATTTVAVARVTLVDDDGHGMLTDDQLTAVRNEIEVVWS